MINKIDNLLINHPVNQSLKGIKRFCVEFLFFVECITHSLSHATQIIHTEKSTVYNVEYWDGRPAWLGKFYESLGFRIHGSRDHRQAVRYIQCSYQARSNSPSPRK